MNKFPKSFKKTAIILVAIVLLISLATVFVVIFNSNKKQKVYVSNWDGTDNRYAICEINGSDSVSTCFGECWTGFTTDMTLDEIVETNQKDYIKDVTYLYDGLKKSAKLFFHGNNYYVIYYEKEFNLYYARCCHGTMQDEEYNIVYFPSPVETIISKDIADSLKKDGENLVNEFYDYCSFDEACDFYKRYIGSNIKINKTIQTISVPGYDVRKNKFIENYITMDWKNKLYTYKNQDGKDIVFDGK